MSLKSDFHSRKKNNALMKVFDVKNKHFFSFWWWIIRVEGTVKKEGHVKHRYRLVPNFGNNLWKWMWLNVITTNVKTKSVLVSDTDTCWTQDTPLMWSVGATYQIKIDKKVPESIRRSRRQQLRLQEHWRAELVYGRW